MRQERALQEAIVHALRLAGYEVLQTTAWRQKGPSGVTPGIPDLLVGSDAVPGSHWLGLEVKTPAGRLSPAQRGLVDRGLVTVVRSEVEALTAVVVWLAWHVAAASSCQGAVPGDACGGAGQVAVARDRVAVARDRARRVCQAVGGE